MANKRDFKKFTEASGASLCESMMVAYYNVEGIDKEKVEQAIGQVLTAVETALINSNVHFDKAPRAFDNPGEYSKARNKFYRALFDKIDGEFDAALDAALKVFNAAIPAAVKETNKAVAE